MHRSLCLLSRMRTHIRCDWLGIFGMTATKSPSQFSGAILPYVHQERAAACSAAPPPVVSPYTDATILKSRFPSWKVENQSQVCSNVCDVSWLPLKIPKCPLKMTFFEPQFLSSPACTRVIFLGLGNVAHWLELLSSRHKAHNPVQHHTNQVC